MKIALYHNADLDGVFCGSILKKFGYSVRGIDYGDDLRGIRLEDVAVIADVSLSEEMMGQLSKDCLYIDHHRRVFSRFKGKTVEVEDGSACLGVARVFYGKVPPAVNVVSQWDAFGERGAYTFNLGWLSEWGLSLVDTVEMFDDVNFYYKKGKIVYDYLKNMWKQAKGVPLGRRSMMFSGPIDGFLCDYLPEHRPIAVGVVKLGNGREKISLRTSTDGLDLRAIAQKFGGGGHPRAAGFIANCGWEKDYE